MTVARIVGLIQINVACLIESARLPTLCNRACLSSTDIYPFYQATEDMLNESPRCNDMVADLDFRGFSSQPFNVK